MQTTPCFSDGADQRRFISYILRQAELLHQTTNNLELLDGSTEASRRQIAEALHAIRSVGMTLQVVAQTRLDYGPREQWPVDPDYIVVEHAGIDDEVR